MVVVAKAFRFYFGMVDKKLLVGLVLPVVVGQWERVMVGQREWVMFVGSGKLVHCLVPTGCLTREMKTVCIFVVIVGMLRL